jgi:hypothetical protein
MIFEKYSSNVFEINENSKIYVDYIESGKKDSRFFVIDDFFQNPDFVVDFLNTISPNVWKENQSPSYNTIYFYDMRHKIKEVEEIKPVYDLLGNISGQKSKSYGEINTNCFKFNPHPFNDYNKNYWYPHRDAGYTGIVYLNTNDLYNGTNIYRPIKSCDDYDDLPEHYSPWYSKEDYDLLLTMPPKYNRMFFFNAYEYWHGMNIYNDRYSYNEYRLNLVFFFDYV